MRVVCHCFQFANELTVLVLNEEDHPHASATELYDTEQKEEVERTNAEDGTVGNGEDPSDV